MKKTNVTPRVVMSTVGLAIAGAVAAAAMLTSGPASSEVSGNSPSPSMSSSGMAGMNH